MNSTIIRDLAELTALGTVRRMSNFYTFENSLRKCLLARQQHILNTQDKMKTLRRLVSLSVLEVDYDHHHNNNNIIITNDNSQEMINHTRVNHSKSLEIL